MHYDVLRYVVEVPWVATMWTGHGRPAGEEPGGRGREPEWSHPLASRRRTHRRGLGAWVRGSAGLGAPGGLIPRRRRGADRESLFLPGHRAAGRWGILIRGEDYCQREVIALLRSSEAERGLPVSSVRKFSWRYRKGTQMTVRVVLEEATVIDHDRPRLPSRAQSSLRMGASPT